MNIEKIIMNIEKIIMNIQKIIMNIQKIIMNIEKLHYLPYPSDVNREAINLAKCLICEVVPAAETGVYEAWK